MTSTYHDGNTPIGASATQFKLMGTNFASDTNITFLLDKHIAPDSPIIQSDNQGNVTTLITVTDAWPLGLHTLTATDAKSNTTQNGATIKIVTPGQANTPGPNGAPPDDAMMHITITMAGGTTGAHIGGNPFLIDVKNGSGCKPPGSYISKQSGPDLNGDGFTYTITTSIVCVSTYQKGLLDFKETVTNSRYVQSNGLVCTTDVSYVAIHLVGSFINATTLSGTDSDDPVTLHCVWSQFFNVSESTSTEPADHLSWTGVASIQTL